jgi:hypothetical protein
MPYICFIVCTKILTISYKKHLKLNTSIKICQNLPASTKRMGLYFYSFINWLQEGCIEFVMKLACIVICKLCEHEMI